MDGLHRTEEKAAKLAKALAMKYLVELDPHKPHKYNVYALLGDELYALTRQALAFRAARLPPRFLCRLNAFVANICAAVPESPLPGVFARLRDRAQQNSWFNRGGRKDGDESSSAGGVGGGGGGGGDDDDDDDEALELPQISEEDLRSRLECYISALWAAANHATALKVAKESFRGKPQEAKEAEQSASQALRAANTRADEARVGAALTAFVNACRAQASLAPNLTLLQNVQPKQRLAPIIDSLCCEVLGVPGVDSTARAQIASLLATYEKQHSFFQSAELNASRVLAPLMADLVKWVRLHEDSIVANSATEGMLAGVPEDLRRRLKEQVYYSEEHFMEVVRSFSDQLGMLPLPLHPLLEESAADASQAMKDMHRERITLDGEEVAPLDFPRLLADRVRPLLERRLATVDEDDDDEDDEEEEDEEEGVGAKSGRDGGSGDSSAARGGMGGSLSSYNLFGDVPGGKGDLHSHSDTKRRRGKVSALAEYLVMRVINAASRTTSGGDAFFIVQDLFGGDGVFVKQSAVTAPPIEVTVDGVSGVVVTSRDCYEIYHEQDVVEATEEAHPLMLMHTSMCETIPLPSDDAMEQATLADANGDDGGFAGGPMGGGSGNAISLGTGASSATPGKQSVTTSSSSSSSAAAAAAIDGASSASASSAATPAPFLATNAASANPPMDHGLSVPAVAGSGDALSTALSKLMLATPLKGAYQSVTSQQQQVRRFLTLNATRPPPVGSRNK